MNKHCYRLIFSRTHGELRVVSELARSCSSEPGQHRGAGIAGENRLWVTLRRAVWLLGLAMFTAPVMASGIVADGSAAPGQRPEVIATQNGLPQVNITAPNQAGVSHNQYQQFDVDHKGAILNNSALMTSTQMAGMIQGNPNLNPNSAPARVILNEVNSNNPSQLRGFLEVAGGKAQVIVANPAGIVCNGCGTINAGRMTLTTGKPQMNADGSLAGYQVERGVISVEGGGLNGDARHDTGYVDLLARAVKVNAGVWAKEEVSVVAGRNRISADGKSVAPLSDNGSAKPQLAIDMGQMGGMYSGSIRMIGTEAGVGVRNQNAQVQAGKTLTVSSEGRLSWQSDAQNAATQAGGDIRMAARDAVDYQGKLHGGGQLSVQSREGKLTQSGTLAAAGDVQLNAARGIASSGHLLAGSDANSQINRDASLRLESQGDIRASGSLLSKKEVDVSGRRVDISGAHVAASRARLNAREGGAALRDSAIDSKQLVINTAADIDARQAQVKAGRWDVTANNLFNQQATWSQTESGESRFALTGRLDNSDGTIESRQLSFSAAALTNSRGSLLALDNAAQQWRVSGLLDNAGGEIGSNGDLRLDAGSLDNQNGTVKTQAALAVTTSGAVSNAGGNLLAGNALTLSAGGDVSNESGTLSGGQLTLSAAGLLANGKGEISGQSLMLTTGSLNNALGKIVAQNDVTLTAQQGLNNAGGWLEAGNGLALNAGGDWDNRGGTAQGGHQVNASALSLDNTGGRLQSGGDLRLKSSGDILNRTGKLTAQQTLRVNAGAASLFDNDGGSLQSGGALTLQGGRLNNRQSGRIYSQNALSLSLDGEWNNQGGTLTGSGSSWVRAANLLNAQGAINALNSLDMQFSGKLDNGQGRIFSQLSQTLNAQDIVNVGGWMGSQGSWHAVSGSFDNAQGSVQSQQDAQLAANWLGNAQGALQSAADLVLHVAQDIDNHGGKVSAQGVLAVQGSTADAHAGAINNAGGQWLAGEALNIAALSLNNSQNGQLYSQKLLRLNLNGELDNRGGRLQSGDALSLDAQALNNAGGTTDARQALTLRILSLLDNTGGTIRSNGDQRVTAGNINNRQGVFSSRGDIDLATAQLDNAGGTLIGQGAGTYHIARLDNQQGKVHSAASLTLDATRVNNQGGQLVAMQALKLRADALDNSAQGTISSQASLDLQADSLNNRDGGLILGTTHTGIRARDIDNAAGRLQSAGTLTFTDVATLDNRQGQLLANGNIAINGGLSPSDSPLALLNQGGRIESAGDLTLHTRTLENQRGTLLGLQSLTLSAQQDYTRTAGETVSSNGKVTFSLSGAFTNLADWLLPGELILNAASITNPAVLVGKTLQLTTGTLQNSGRIEADTMTMNVDTLDNAAALMGDDITVRARALDNHGQPAVIAATHRLTLQAGERLSNRDGALLYSGDSLSLHSDDLIENRASFIEADGDLAVEARRLDNLREGLEIQRDAEKSDYKWHRYNYYWRTYGSAVNPDKSTMAPTTQQLTFQDDAAAQSNRYGTLLAIDAAGKRAQVRVKDNKGQLTDLWVNYLALKPNADGSYAMTFYETRGGNQLATIPTPYQNGFHWEHDWTQVLTWDPEKHIDIDSAPFITDYNNFRERTESGTVTRDRLVSEGIGARILAGGNMLLRITGQLLNDASVITAGGNLTQDGGGSVDNRGYSVNERRQAVIVDHYDKDTHHWYPTFNRDETTALTTVDGIITGNGTVTINGASMTNTTVNQAQISRLESALNAVDAERAELERNPLAFTVEGAAPVVGDTALAPGATPSSPLGRPLLPAELALTQLQHLGNVATAIPNNALFAQHTAPASPFLVVTDERFTNRDKFISSDYLLDRVGYDPAQVHKRLGDGFYEQRLVREQVLALTGKASVRGKDAMAQYQQLMNNGSQVAQDFHLVPGVALTPEQIAALQQDIVWLVSETVQTADGPQTVWVPKVYLAQSTLRLSGDGAVIGGGNLQLSASSITNAGNLFADKALTVDAGQFLHQGGDIKAGSIDVQADTLSMSSNLQDALRQATMSADDISLRGTDIGLAGAKLTATDTLSLSARNNLTITTARSSHTADLGVISGSMGNRTRGGTEAAGSRMAQVSGEWQQALGSELNAGGNLTLNAGRDVTLTGSQLQAGGQLGVQAGGNINLLADKTTNSTHLDANSRTSSVSNSREEQRLALSALGGDQGVTLVAGNQLLAEGAQVASKEGRIGISAQDVTIKDARTHTQDQDSENKREGKTKSHRIEQTTRETSSGSTFSGQQGVTVIGREGNVTVTGSALHSDQGAIALQAKQDVTLNTATERESTFSEERSQKKGFLKKSSSHSVAHDATTRETGTLLSGESVSVSAGNDLTVTGSAIAADRDVNLQAGHNVDIGAATETDTHYRLDEKKKSGLLGSGGIGFTIGKQSSKHEVDEKGRTQSQSVSTVGSSQGNVSITAGNQLHIGGADLVAARDLALTGDSVAIDPGYDQRTRRETFEQKQSGLNLALSGSVGSALNTAVSTAQQARKEGDGRLNALQNTKAALSGVQAAQAWARDDALTGAADAKNAAAGLQSGDKGAAQGATNTVGVTASWGSQSSKSETRTDSRQSQGSTLNAGQNLSITATGKNNAAQSGDIAISGSQLKAVKNLTLDAARDITLHSAQNSESTSGTNSSKGGSVGVGIGAGTGGYGISVSAGVNAGKGHENGSGLTHSETTLDAGSHLSLTSGRDTTLKGAQASGEKITVDAGRNLTLESERDSDRYDAKQQNASAGGSFTLGSMTGSASVSASRDRLKSNFDSVKEQTGLFAGKGGYDVRVGEHTQLDGAVIASTADTDSNRLDTGTLGWSDIHNQADYRATHSGGSLSTGGPVGKDLLTNMAGGMLSGANNSGHAEGTTKAGVSEGALLIRDKDGQQQDVTTLNRDTDHANDGSISPIFNREKEQNRLRQAQLIGEIAGQAMDVIRTQGDIAGLKAQTDPAALAQAREQLKKDDKPFRESDVLQRAYNNAMQQYGTGSDLQKAAQAVTGALTALAGNNLAGALASGASPYLATEIKKLTTNPLTGKVDVTSNAMAHAVLGAVTAQLNNQSAVAGGLGAGGGELAARYIAGQLFPGKTADQLSESEKQQVSALSQLAAGLAGGVASGDTGGAVAAAQAGKNAVEDNYLSNAQKAQKDKEIAACQTLACKAGAQAKWTAIDLGQDGSFAAGMVAGVPAGLYDTIDSIVKTASNPQETYDALKSLFNSGDVLGNVSDAVKQSYIERINRMEAEYQKAGASGSFNAGVNGGKLVTDIAGLLAGGAGVVKGGAVLTEKVVAKTTGMVETALKSSVVNKILEADRIGSGLKPDPTHRGASYLSREQLMDGKVFTIKGGDGIERKLLQAEGSFNDKKGIFEYIYDNKGNVTHQRFIEGGNITGIPNQRPPKVK
ncbi:hemagglutinin repeat-containing protein [Erwinia aphidicola]|uniref:hemagglutinin repeat-containing protein n=2 Tax=Erwinia aphidicola TaxID=68334 RepID=UPI003CEA9BA0